MAVPGALPAPLPRRLLAFVIDAVAVLLCGGSFLAVGVARTLVGALDGTSPERSALPVLGAGLLLALGVAQWRMLATSGWTLGRRLTGIRLVRSTDGAMPGAGRSFVRLAVPLLVWLVPVVGPVLLHLSPLTDERRRGWHDKAAGLMAVDVVSGVDPAGAAVAARRLDDVLRTSVPAGPSGAVPPPPPRPEPLAALPWQVRREAAARDVDLVPGPPVRTAAAPAGTAAREPSPVVGTVPWPGGPTTSVLDLEDTAVGTALAHGRHVAPGPEPAPEHRPVPVDPSTEPSAGPMPGDVRDTAGRPVTRVVPPAPVHTSTSFASSAEQEDVEATRLRPARGKVPELAEGRRQVTVELTDGQRVTIRGTALVGRNPSPRPGEIPDRLIRVADPGRSVSKTHLLLGVDRSGLWLKDRDSTNGTVVTLADGQQILCGAEQQVRLPVGASVAFGDYGLSVVPTEP